MPPVPPLTFDHNTTRLRLRTITRLRWFAVLGQTAAVALIYFGLGFDLPIGLCAMFIAFSAWLNIAISLKYDSRMWLQANYATAMLGYDVLQLASLLYLTGGLQNPFAFLIIAPVMVSASKQPVINTVQLGVLVFICVTFLMFYHQPLPWYPGESINIPLTLIAGSWAALVCGALFFALYAQRIAKEAQQMSQALAATEAVLMREQSLSALDGLAAAAAHELGTPLSTIAVVARELQRELPEDNPHSDDLALLRTEADRCREILARLSAGSDEPDAMFMRVSVTQLLEEVVEPHRVFDVAVRIDAETDEDADGEIAAREVPVSVRNPGILYGLGNIIENAVDFAEDTVVIRARWNAERVSISVRDDGPGFPAQIRERLGEPYVTTRHSGVSVGQENDEGYGLGLGFFIAKTLLERTGARLTFFNSDPPDTGANVEVVWPRDSFEANVSAIET